MHKAPVYETQKVWHFSSGDAKKGKWQMSLCGRYFRPDLRENKWVSCQDCTTNIPPPSNRDRLRLWLNGKSVFKPLPKSLKEQRFEPPTLEGV